MEKTPVIKIRGITKHFKGNIANNNISMDINKGEILSVLGENGSGKTTLMNMLSGIYFPDDGSIFINDKEVSITSPKDAIDLGIGMIHQHFKLVDVFTAAENIILGIDEKFNLKLAKERISKICDQYGFKLDLDQKIYDMSVSQKQTVEILKVLYRGAEILILDEPTAVLTPQETNKLFEILKNMRNDGKTIILITHKLNEVEEISDRVVVLRKGEYVGEKMTCDTTINEMTDMMVGHHTSLNIERPEPKNPTRRLKIDNLTIKSVDGITKLDNVSFEANSGEILGFAGISGCGQKELLESIAGLQVISNGSIKFYNDDDTIEELVGKNPLDIEKLGVSLSFVPEDRLGMGLVANMDLTDNMMLRSFRNGSTPMVNRKDPKNLADDIIEKLEVVTPGTSTEVRKLSGGNVQKILLGREIASAPKVLLTAYATRGLDINASFLIYDMLNKQKEKGVAIIYVGEDLDVLLQLCDKIVVLCGGKINGILNAKETTKEEVGRRMMYIDEEAK